MINPLIKLLLGTVILIVLTALFAKSQIKLPIVAKLKITPIETSMLIAQQKESSKKAHQALGKRFLVQQNNSWDSKNNISWQLYGIVKTGGENFALIRQREKITRYQQGDTLFDGSKIIGIHANGILVSTGVEEQEYRLYQK